MKTNISDLVQEVDQRDPEQESIVFSVSERLGIVPQEELFTKPIATEDKSKYRCIEYGDLVYNPYLLWNGAAGVCFDRQGGCVSPAYIVLRPKESGIERFLHYLFRSSRFVSVVDSLATGSVTRRRTVPIPDLLSLCFELPNQVQLKAANELLELIDGKLSMIRRSNETLEAIAQTIFQSWFIDYDPIHAKVLNRDLTMPNEIEAAFPTSFEVSNGLNIPKGWRPGTLGDIADNLRRSAQPDDIAPETHYIGLEHMPKKSIALIDWSYADSIKSNKYRFEKEEILFGKLRPYFHKVIVAPMSGVCSTDILVIAPKKAHWFAYVLCHISSARFIEFTNASSTGTKMPRTNWTEMSSYELLLPTDDLITAFNQVIQPFVDRIFAGIQEFRILTGLRDIILPRLLSGQLYFKDLEDVGEKK